MEMLSAVAADAPAPHAAPGLSRLSDELLARYVARGSTRAFEAVYRRYHQLVYKYCRSILRHDADAQDALQSTFANALVALKSGRRSAPLRPWLFRIAHNESISIIRKRRHDQLGESVQQVAGSAPSAEDQAGAREEWTTLLSDLSELPDKQRGALLQRELSGLSHEEIALVLGTSAGAAKQLIFEARQALAEIAEGREMSCVEVRRRISDGDRRVLRGRRVRSHMRSCAGCTEFAAAIPARRAELRAVVPLLGPVAAGELFSRALRAAGGHGSAGAGAPAAGAAAGAAGKLAGGGMIWKAIAGGVILAGAAVGVTRLHHTHHNPVSAPLAHHAGASQRSGSPESTSAGSAQRDRGLQGRAHHGVPNASARASAAGAIIGLPAVHKAHQVASLTPTAPAATAPAPAANAPGRGVSSTRSSGSHGNSGHSHGGGSGKSTRGASKRHAGGRSGHGRSGSSNGSSSTTQHQSTSTTRTHPGNGSGNGNSRGTGHSR